MVIHTPSYLQIENTWIKYYMSVLVLIWVGYLTESRVLKEVKTYWEEEINSKFGDEARKANWDAQLEVCSQHEMESLTLNKFSTEEHLGGGGRCDSNRDK